jgi:acetolactate synthase I/II/III large subunit
MKAAELFVRCLENEGVQYVFGIPGEEINELLRALHASKKIKFILCTHEQAASFMADVYGRLTGKAGVCLSTLGPGATNLLTGVADAYLDRVPVVAITGQGALGRAFQESHQYIDVVSVYKFVTKWNRSITRAEFIPQAVRKAFELAESEKPGAVHLELPEDVAVDDVDPEILPLPRTHTHLPAVVNPEGARAAISLIWRARSPIILAGNGVIRSGASAAVHEFASEFKIPVVTTFMGKGLVSSRDDLFLGTIGLQTRDLINCAFDKADLVITIGYDIVEISPQYWNGDDADKPIIHIDSAPSETDPYYHTRLELTGDISAVLNALVEESRTSKSSRSGDTSSFARLRSMMNEELTRYANNDAFPLKPQRIIYELREALADEDIVVSDVGMHKVWLSRLYPAFSPNTVIISNGFAAMGISLPGAIAAKLARPDRRVVAVCGDGGAMMNLYSLATAKALGLSFVLVIFDDGQYSQIDWKQRSKFGESYFVKFKNPDFVKVAESLGCTGVRVSTAAELKSTLSKALKSEGVWVLDVPVDTEENLLLSERLGENVTCPEEA